MYRLDPRYSDRLKNIYRQHHRKYISIADFVGERECVRATWLFHWFFLSDLKRGFVKRDCLKIHLRKKSHCLMPPKYVGIIIISVTIFLNNLIYLHSSKIIFGSICFLEDPNFLDVSQNVSPRGMKKVKWLWILYFLRVKHFYFILVPRSLIIVKFSLI